MSATQHHLFGASLHAALSSTSVPLSIERDDGFVESHDPSAYLPGKPLFPAVEAILGAAFDRCVELDAPFLDIGAGAGRACLLGAARGAEPLAIEPDKLAREILLQTAPSARIFPGELHEYFDFSRGTRHLGAALMIGGNIGILGCAASPADSLSALADRCLDGALLVAEGRDRHATDESVHLDYWAGRDDPFCKFRLLLDGYPPGPWHRWWMPVADELVAALGQAGWTPVSVEPIGSKGSFVAVARLDRIR